MSRDHDDIHLESLENLKHSQNLSCDFVFVRDIEYIGNL